MNHIDYKFIPSCRNFEGNYNQAQYEWRDGLDLRACVPVSYFKQTNHKCDVVREISPGSFNQIHSTNLQNGRWNN